MNWSQNSVWIIINWIVFVSPVDTLASSEDDDEDEESSSEEAKLLGSQKLLRKCADLFTLPVLTLCLQQAVIILSQKVTGLCLRVVNSQWFESFMIQLWVWCVRVGHIWVNDFTVNQRVFHYLSDSFYMRNVPAVTNYG